MGNQRYGRGLRLEGLSAHMPQILSPLDDEVIQSLRQSTDKRTEMGTLKSCPDFCICVVVEGVKVLPS